MATLRRLRAIRKRTPQYSGSSERFGPPVEGVSLLDTMQSIDMIDMGLFTEDFDLWFAKSMFQYYLALAIQREHIGNGSINPMAVLERIEANTWEDPSRSEPSTEDTGFCGRKLFGRIKAARRTKNNKTLEVFLTELSEQIVSECRKLRDKDMAELDAECTVSPLCIRRPTTPASASISSNSPPLEDTQEAGTMLSTESSSSGDSGPGTSSVAEDVAPAHNPQEIPMPKYTEMLRNWAASLGKGNPEYHEKLALSDTYCYVVSFDGIQAMGEAPSKKHAKHVASRKLYEILRASAV